MKATELVEAPVLPSFSSLLIHCGSLQAFFRCCTLLSYTVLKSYHYLITHVSQQLLLINCSTAIFSDVKRPQLILELNVDLWYSRYGMLGVVGVEFVVRFLMCDDVI